MKIKRNVVHAHLQLFSSASLGIVYADHLLASAIRHFARHEKHTKSPDMELVAPHDRVATLMMYSKMDETLVLLIMNACSMECDVAVTRKKVAG